MRAVILAFALALAVAPALVSATHPCFGPDCGIPHDTTSIKRFVGEAVSCVVTPSPPLLPCLKDALP